MKVLIAEDDFHTRRGLTEILTDEGYDVRAAASGKQAWEFFEEFAPDFVCLDIMMPEQGGYQVCKQIRERNAQLPIIFISAKTEELDKLVGFDLGADDFIEKPFSVREVIARIRAVTRRCYPESNHVDSFTLANVQVFPSQLRAKRGDEVIELSLRDIKLLTLFHQRQGEALDRHTIFNVAWGVDHFPNSRTLDQHISQLRKRIELDPKHPKIIETVHGVGYRYDG